MGETIVGEICPCNHGKGKLVKYNSQPPRLHTPRLQNVPTPSLSYLLTPPSPTAISATCESHPTTIPTAHQPVMQRQHSTGKPTAQMLKTPQDAQLKLASWQDLPLHSCKAVRRTGSESDRGRLNSLQRMCGRFVRPLLAIPLSSTGSHLLAPQSAPATPWDKPVNHQTQTPSRPLPPLPPLSHIASSDDKEFPLLSPSDYFTPSSEDGLNQDAKSTSPSLFPKVDSSCACVDRDVAEISSPTTAQRRWVAKLRHLGGSVGDLLAHSDTHQPTAHSRSTSISGSSVDHGNIMFKHQSVYGGDSAETSEDEEGFEDEVSQDYEGEGCGEDEIADPADYSKKWVFERGGRRWVVKDYDQVLHALRIL